MNQNHNAELAAFAAGLRFKDLPAPVLRKTEDLMVDWFASSIAGHGARPVSSIAHFASAMDPAQGPSEVIVTRKPTSPYLAAMNNAATAHVSGHDDVHNGSVIRPATVHQSTFSKVTVLTPMARFRHADLPEFEAHYRAAGSENWRWMQKQRSETRF